MASTCGQTGPVIRETLSRVSAMAMESGKHNGIARRAIADTTVLTRKPDTECIRGTMGGSTRETLTTTTATGTENCTIRKATFNIRASGITGNSQNGRESLPPGKKSSPLIFEVLVSLANVTISKSLIPISAKGRTDSERPISGAETSGYLITERTLANTLLFRILESSTYANGLKKASSSAVDLGDQPLLERTSA